MGSPWATTVAIIAAWYGSNIGVLLLNKALLTNVGFRQPVFLTMCHMTACAALGATLAAAKVTPLKALKSAKQVQKIFLLSALFCVTIVLGNVSLKWIPVSFNQAIGATTPFFTAVFALTMQGVKELAHTYLALVPVVGGIVVATLNEPSFHLIGFMACMSATAGRALKSVVQSILLTDANEKLDPMSLLLYMSGFSLLLLVPATVLLEPSSFGQALTLMATRPGFGWWLLCNSTLAYAVNLTNFLVTKHTSALTLQVLGNMKGVVAVFVSVLLFRNPVTVKGMLGYFITVSGVICYSESKRRSKLAPKPDRSKDMDPESQLLMSQMPTSNGSGMRQRQDS